MYVYLHRRQLEVKKYLIFYMAIAIVQATDIAYGSLRDDSDVIGKNKIVAQLLSLPDCDNFCIK